METTNKDERKGRPSASIMERLSLCPGSWNASKGKEAIRTKEMIEWAAKGDRVHLYLESPSLMAGALSEDEQEVADQIQEKLEEIVERVFPTLKSFPLIVEEREKRIWEVVVGHYSGRLDYMLMGIDNNTAQVLVTDYKSGWGDQADVVENMQLRTQAVLASNHARRKGYSVSVVHAAIAQPKLAVKDSIVTYRKKDLEQAEREIYLVVTDAQKKNAPLRPGKKQCQFCPAKRDCKAYAKWIGELPKSTSELEDVDGAKLADWLEAWKSYQETGKALEQLAKDMLEKNADSVPGWSLKPSGNMRSIVDPKGLWNHLFARKYLSSPDQFMDCVSVKIGALEKALKTVNGYDKAALKRVVDGLESFIETKPKAPSLVKK